MLNFYTFLSAAFSPLRGNCWVVFQPLSVCGWTLGFLLIFHRFCGAIEGRLIHFLPRWLRSQGGLAWCDQPGKVSSRYSAMACMELNPSHRKDWQWAIPLSYHDWSAVGLDPCISTGYGLTLSTTGGSVSMLHLEGWFVSSSSLREPTMSAFQAKRDCGFVVWLWLSDLIPSSLLIYVFVGISPPPSESDDIHAVNTRHPLGDERDWCVIVLELTRRMFP